jgi:hypothetical protein
VKNKKYLKMAEDQQLAVVHVQAAANPNDMNELKTLFSNPKVDIPIFYGDHTKDLITAKFMFDCIKIAQTTYHWSNSATAGNCKLAHRGKAFNWLNYIKDTEQIDILLWSRFEPQFKSHYDI